MGDTIEQMKAEASSARAKASWRENEQRLIWCGLNDDGSFTFRNTTSATSKGPRISETEAAKFLAAEGPWLRPHAVTEQTVTPAV
jgi:hypothetical protein